MVEALLADGWYRGQVGMLNAHDQWGTETAFLAQLELEHEDGTTTVVGTDESWRWATSHITETDLIEGQHEDRRLLAHEPVWSPVVVSERGYDALVCSPPRPCGPSRSCARCRSRRCEKACSSSTSARTSTGGYG